MTSGHKGATPYGTDDICPGRVVESAVGYSDFDMDFLCHIMIEPPDCLHTHNISSIYIYKL